MNKKIGRFFIYDAKVGDLSPEVVGMRANSVKTVVLSRDNDGQHFTLAAT